MKLSRLFFLLLALPVLPALGRSNGLLAAESKSAKKGSVAVTLVSDAAAIEPGKPFTVALRMQHDPHWHSYWIAAGTGYPTAITWTLPEGFKAGAIQWPTPQILRDSAKKIVGNGYSDESFLLVEITPSSTLAAGGEVKLPAAIEWLMCEDVCMPGDAKLEISFPAAAAGAAQVDDKWTKAIAETRDKLPKPATGWSITAAHTDKTATLRLTPKPGTTHQPADLHFFSADAYTDYEKPQAVKAENGGWVIEMPLDAAADPKTARLTGVLTSANGWSDGAGYAGLAIDVPFADGKPVAATAAPTGSSSQPTTNNSQPAAASSLLATLALAFLGGLVLNLMPCVFPVLGIKVLGFVNLAGHEHRKVVAHGLTFTFGVLLSFWVLAGILLALRAAGNELGWGAQLQYPTFNFGLAAFLLIFALNLSGLFEFGLVATGVGGKLQMQPGYSGSFFTGALAVLVATPCSAPFLAPALGAAFSKAFSPGESMAIFTFIGLGLALPYLLLSIFPAAIRLLPKPGAWMETFKQFMSFLLYATVGWLIWVLSAQINEGNSLLLALFGFTLIGMAAWAYGRFGQAHGAPGRRRAGQVAALMLLIGGGWLGWPKTVEAKPAATAGYTVQWEHWSPEAVAAARAAGRTIYVDFTARWCFTCQTNKGVVFSSSEVLAELRKRNVLLLKGDWTNRDPKITAELARWNRSAVPFNLIYAPDKSDPVILPELLTPDRVLAGFASLSRSEK